MPRMIVGVMDVMENFFWIGIVGALIALLFAYSQAKKVKQYSEGTPTMQKIAAAIRKGANAYLKRQYKTVALIFAVIAVILAILAFVASSASTPRAGSSRSSLRGGTSSRRRRKKIK